MHYILSFKRQMKIYQLLVVFFHLTQNIAKRMQSEGLKRYYENDVAFALMVRTIPALAFVTPDRIVEIYEALEELMPNEMLPLLDYFERTYIGRAIQQFGNL